MGEKRNALWAAVVLDASSLQHSPSRRHQPPLTRDLSADDQLAFLFDGFDTDGTVRLAMSAASRVVSR